MICEFSYSNFRSFKNEAVLDFSAKPIKEIEDSLINIDEMLFLPVCVIYGPNGGGKSSVLMALKILQEIIIEPLLQMGFMKNKNEKLASYPVEKLCKVDCGGWDRYERFWLVYDKDDFPYDNFDNTQFSAEKRKGSKIRVAWSNECIELWFLLHFQEYVSNNGREQYIKKLNEYFGYSKSREDL